MRTSSLFSILICGSAHAAASLEGVWQTPCMPAGGGWVQVWTFGENSFRFDSIKYEDADCTVYSPTNSFSFSGTYSTGDAFGEGTAIDLAPDTEAPDTVRGSYGLFKIESEGGNDSLYMGGFAPDSASRSSVLDRTRAFALR